MDKESSFSSRLCRISTVVVAMLLAVYVLANLLFQVPFSQYAVDGAWNFASVLDRVKSVVNGRVLGQEVYMDTYASLEKHMNKQESGGFQVVRGENDELIYTDFFPFDTYEYYQYAMAMKQLDDITEEDAFLFINGIDLYNGPEDNYGIIPVANLQRRTDALNYYLQGYGVNYLDSRDFLFGVGAEGNVRFKTDVHWTIDASFDVFSGILSRLKSDHGLDLDPSGFYGNKDNYMQIKYPRRFAGNLGQRTGIPFSGYDDFTLYTPAFPTDFTMTTSHFGRTKTEQGSFDAVFIDKQLLEANSVYERRMYEAYMGGQAPLRVIANHNKPDGVKVLLIGDTYMVPIASFMATVAGELHFLWTYENPFVEDLEAYIKTGKFDAVLIGMSSLSIRDDSFKYLGDTQE